MVAKKPEPLDVFRDLVNATPPWFATPPKQLREEAEQSASLFGALLAGQEIANAQAEKRDAERN